ncbi:hypothetical protein [Brevibacillus sp. NRS-1366]|uniref:hypothetical protein n=1 Tax=Brevibacillus sp. NRS-1366 TaxID=3233899 RepID=UPI003D1F550B
MLQFMVEKLSDQLSVHGVITDIVLRSDHSLLAEEELQEVIISFAASEEENVPMASIHLFLMQEQGSCEVEVEVAYPGNLEEAQVVRQWERARTMIPEISLTEKRRYLEPEKMAEASFLLDYHFVVEQPVTDDEEAQFAKTMEQFAKDLGKLVNIGE